MVRRDCGHLKRLYAAKIEGSYPPFTSGILQEVGDLATPKNLRQSIR